MDFAGRADTNAGEVDFAGREPRAITTLLIGRIVTAANQDKLCRIRNVSTGGMLVECTTHLTEGDHITIELRCGTSLSGIIAWAEKNQAGVRFEKPVEVAQLLDKMRLNQADQRQISPRSLRFATDCPARVTSLGHTATARLENLSQTGVRVCLKTPLPIESPVSVTIPGLGTLHAAVRWQEDDEVGLAFLDMIPFAELNAWLAEQQPC